MGTKLYMVTRTERIKLLRWDALIIGLWCGIIPLFVLKGTPLEAWLYTNMRPETTTATIQIGWALWAFINAVIFPAAIARTPGMLIKRMCFVKIHGTPKRWEFSAVAVFYILMYPLVLLDVSAMSNIRNATFLERHLDVRLAKPWV